MAFGRQTKLTRQLVKGWVFDFRGYVEIHTFKLGYRSRKLREKVDFTTATIATDFQLAIGASPKATRVKFQNQIRIF